MKLFFYSSKWAKANKVTESQETVISFRVASYNPFFFVLRSNNDHPLRRRSLHKLTALFVTKKIILIAKTWRKTSEQCERRVFTKVILAAPALDLVTGKQRPFWGGWRRHLWSFFPLFKRSRIQKRGFYHVNQFIRWTGIFAMAASNKFQKEVNKFFSTRLASREKS